MKDIKNFEGLYSITENGEVWSYRSKKFLKQEQQNNGYKRVLLYVNGVGKHYLIHRLVAETYIPNPENKPCVNHIDENRENNYVSNLEWCSYKENNNYGTRTAKAAEAKSKAVKQLTLNGELIKIWKSAAEASKALNTQVYRAANGSRKTAGGYKWEYV